MTSFVVDSQHLRQALKIVTVALPKNTTMSILESVCLAAGKDQRLHLTVTDLELMAITSVPFEGPAPAGFTVSAKKLYDLSRLVDKDCQMEFSWDSSKSSLAIKAGRSRHKLTTQDAIHFPGLDISSELRSFQVSGKHLRTALDRILPAVANKDSRHVLNTCLIEAQGNTLHCVGSDGHRIAVQSLPLKNVPDFSLSLSRRTVTELMKLVGGDEVEVIVGGNAIGFNFGDHALWSRFIAEPYPAWRRLLPGRSDNTARINCPAFARMIERICVSGDKTIKGIDLEVAEGLLKATHSEPSESSEDVLDVEGHGRGKFCGNSSYVHTAVTVLREASADLWLPEMERMPLIVALDDEVGAYRHVVAPFVR